MLKRQLLAGTLVLLFIVSELGVLLPAVQAASVTLTVSSAHGSPNPTVGSHSYNSGTSVTCSVSSPVTESSTAWKCTGWTGTGSVPSSGTGISVTFTITATSSITWIWQNSGSLSSGSVTPLSGTTADTFRYYVSYSDSFGANALGATVLTDTGTYGMGVYSGSGSNGVYSYSTTLPVGTNHWYYFRFTSGSSGVVIWLPPQPYDYTGPTVTPIQRKLTVNTAHDTGNPPNGVWNFDDGRSISCTVTSPVTENGWVWTCTGWSGTGSVPSSGSGAFTGYFTITQDSSVTWHWTGVILKHTLTVYSAHDTPVPSGSPQYNDGDSVTCSVTSQIVEGNTLWTCTGWTGTGSVQSSGTLNTVTFPIYQDSSITWNWQGVPMYAVTITSGNGGTVSYSSAYPVGSGTVPSGQFVIIQAPSGAQISLNANHDSEHIFSVWTTSGSVSVYNPTFASTTLTVNGIGAATANFASTLAVSISPASATIQTQQSVPFTATASGGSGAYTDYKWYWTEYGSANHGSYDSGSLNTYSFAPPEAGSYGVYVVVTDSHSNSAQSSTSSVTVQAPPPPPTCSLQVLVFNKAPGNPILGATITMISAPNGQNHLSGTTDSSGQYTFQNILTGSYTVQATALGYSADTGSATILAGQMGQIQIILISTLSASASASAAGNTIPLSVQFTGSASGGASPYTYFWTFGDGSSSNQQNPSYTFQTAGNYIATLSVTDSQGNTAMSSVTINAFAQVHFSESGLPNLPSVSWTVTFNGQTETSSSPGNSLYVIAFAEPNGGPYSFSVTPPAGYRVFPPSGSITVNGKDRIIGVSFSLLAPLLASASVSPASGTGPLPVQFTGSASGGVSPYSYLWNFGDGSSSNQQNPSYTYSTTGTHIATLTVADAMGNMAQSMAVVTISSAYSVSFVASGLSLGTSWSVIFNGNTQSSTTSLIVFSQSNGQYSYSINPVSGYTCSPSQGSITIASANVIQYITFTSSPTHVMTFSESGLASGITWSVTVNNVGTKTATSPGAITFAASNGVYSYTLGPIAGYSPSPSSGTITVSGKNINQLITYSATPINLLIKSEYSGYFLQQESLINSFGVYAPIVNSAPPIQVYGILDGINYPFSNPKGPGDCYSLSVDMGSLTLGSSLNVFAVYAGGTRLNQEYPIQMIQTPSWLISIFTYARDKNVEKSTQGEWDNVYTLNLDAEFDLSKTFSQDIQLPDFAGGGKYTLLPSVDLTFSFCSSGTLEMAGEFTLDAAKSSGTQLAFGPVEVTPHLTISASGKFSLQGDSITWLEGDLSIGAGAEGEYTPPSPIGFQFDIPGYGPVTFGITLTAKVKADFAVDMILGPALDASKEPVQPLEIALQSITGAITFGVGLELTAGIGVFALKGGGDLDFNFNLEATSPFLSGIDVSGDVYVKVHVFCADLTVWSMTGDLYQWPTNSAADPDPGNFTLTPRYYNTPNYEELEWTNGGWNGTAVSDIYPFTSISAASSGNNAYILYTTDNLSLVEQNGLCLTGLEFDSNQRNLQRLSMPPIAGEIFINPAVTSLPNGSILAMWDSIPFTEVGSGTDPLSFNKIIPQYSCYDPSIGNWNAVTNLTDDGVATSYLLSPSLTNCYGLVLEGDSIFPSNQYLAEYNLSNHSELFYIGVANVSNIISFNALSQTAVLQLYDGSFEVLNLTAHMPITIPLMNGYNIMYVELATNSSDSLGILYCSSTANMFCIYDISSGTFSFSMNVPQIPNYLTFAQQGSGYRLITADPSGITSYFIQNQSAGTPLFYPIQNITSMGSTITDNGILVYTTQNYGNSTDPLLSLSLTFLPLIPEVNVTLNTPGLQTALNVVHYTQNSVQKTGSIIGNTFSDFVDVGSNITIDNPISVSVTQKCTSNDPTFFTIQSDETFTVKYATQWYITFDQTGVDTNFNGTVMTINGTGYSGGSISFWAYDQDTYMLNYISPLVVTSNQEQYEWISTTGLSTLQSDLITITHSGTVTGNFATQYKVSFDQTGLDPSASGSPIATINGSTLTYTQLPYSLWVNEGNEITYNYESLVSSSNSDQQFKLDTVTGSPSPILISGPLNVTANYVTQFNQYNVTFSIMGALGPEITGNIITIDGTNYSGNQFPVSFLWGNGSIHNFSFTLTLSLNASCGCSWWSTSGLSNLRNGTLTVGASGSIIGTFGIVGDIDHDSRVSLTDLVLLANAYGSRPGDVKWNTNADISGNGFVDLVDLVMLANHYGQHYP